MRISALALLYAGLTGCGGSSLQPLPGDVLAAGTWGGDDAGVIVTESLAHVHIGCTFGDVTGEIAIDDEGRFTVDGSYVLRAYPVMIGPELPAQFSGHVVGRTLTLAVAVNDTVEGKIVALGPVSVEYDREPGLRTCPVCQVPPSADEMVGAASRDG